MLPLSTVLSLTTLPKATTILIRQFLS
jgi:hypothetical protein